jgi:uncharacterized protein (DUF302 family)
MTLPIDPTAIDPDDVGEEQARVELAHDETIELVREACLSAGFGIPAEFSPSALLNEKVDADRDPYYVLGACNPEMADRGLTASAKKLGALFPCNVVIWAAEPGVQRVYHVSIMRIARLVGMAPDDEDWQAIVDETGAMVADLFDGLAGHDAVTYPV